MPTSQGFTLRQPAEVCASRLIVSIRVVTETPVWYVAPSMGLNWSKRNPSFLRKLRPTYRKIAEFHSAPACHGDAYLAYLRKKVPLRPAAGRTTLCQD